MSEQEIQEQLKARIKQVNELQQEIYNLKKTIDALEEENLKVKELQRELALLKDNIRVGKFDIESRNKAIENLKKQIANDEKILWTRFFVATISRTDRSYNEFVEFTNKTMAKYKSHWAKQNKSQGDSNDESRRKGCRT